MGTTGGGGIAPVRRVVAGPGADGAPAFTFDGDSPHVVTLPGLPPDLGLTDVWASTGMPPENDASAADPVPAAFAIGPAADGTLLRVVQFPSPSGDPLWHRTDTLDYNVVVSGEIVLMIEGGDEVTLGPGDCAVVRGITHAWENRGTTTCILAAVSVAALPTGG